MKKEVGGILATAFLATTLGLPMRANAAEVDANVSSDRIPTISKETQQQIINDANEYLTQLIIQNRYTTATRIVWVYGCADKS